MNDNKKTKSQLLEELASLRQRLATLEAAEQSRHESEERYRLLTESTTDMIYILNQSGDVLYANCSAAAGICHPAGKLVGKRQEELFSPERVRQHVKSVASVFQTGEVHDSDGIYHFGSEEIWLNTRLMPLRDECGKVTAIMGVSRNITARKRAEAALKQAHEELETRVEERTAELAEANKNLRLSEEKYRGFVDICPDAILVSDLTGKTQFVSKQTWKLLELPEQDDLVGKSTFDYLIEADRPRLAANLADLLSVGERPGCTEYTVLRPDGTTVPIELSSAVIRDAQGRLTATMAIIRNISERKQSEESLRQSEEKYRELVEICPDAIVVTDLAGKVMFVSKQAWKMLNASEEEALDGRSVFDFLVESERPRMEEGIFELLSTGKHKHSEYSGLSPDGTTIPTEISTTVIRNAQGQPTGMMAIIRDISDRKQAEETLRKEHRTLKHLLQSSDHERQLIAYEIHDGLAQQLAGAIMQLETYSYQKTNKPKEARKAFEAATTMLRQAHFEARRLISGVRPPILDESGIVAAVAHLVNEHRLQNGPKIEFRGDVSFSRLATIMENAIYRIVQEALANACQHSKSPKVRVELAQRDDVLQVKVTDWGIGFDPNHVKDDRFGLEGIRERARLLGGIAKLDSTPGQGTCITVELPLALEENE
jgi:PAS domain S-box-containing protein